VRRVGVPHPIQGKIMKTVIALAGIATLLACSNEPATNVQTANAPVTAEAPGAAPAFDYRGHVAASWAAGPPVTPAEVAEMLDRQGAQATVGALWGESDNSRWATVARGIAMGDPAWLELAPRIAEGVDAGTSTEFSLALQDALTTNAAGALRLMSRLGDGAAGCTDNSMEAPPEQVRGFYAAATASVEAVRDPALQEIRNACLAQLRTGAEAG
jgi:hypothetical protein